VVRARDRAAAPPARRDLRSEKFGRGFRKPGLSRMGPVTEGRRGAGPAAGFA
jgi:hypothetical protein